MEGICASRIFLGNGAIVFEDDFAGFDGSAKLKSEVGRKDYLGLSAIK